MGRINVDAQYVGTMLPDYLQDSYSRPGETLLLTSLGSTLTYTIQDLIDSLDWDCGFPEVSNDDLAWIIGDALSGVDLRYIDEHGNRCDEPAEDRNGEEPYIYVVLRWTVEE